MENTTGLDLTIREMANRIKELRQIESISEEAMAEKVGLGLEEYRRCESGQSDLNFAFFLIQSAHSFAIARWVISLRSLISNSVPYRLVSRERRGI